MTKSKTFLWSLLFTALLAAALIAPAVADDPPSGGEMCYYHLYVHAGHDFNQVWFYAEVLGQPCGNVIVQYEVAFYKADGDDPDDAPDLIERPWVSPPGMPDGQPLTRQFPDLPFGEEVTGITITAYGLCDSCGKQAIYMMMFVTQDCRRTVSLPPGCSGLMMLPMKR